MKKIMKKLNKRLFPLLVALVLVLGFCVPLTAYADWMPDPLDYQQLDYTVKYGSEYNDVSFVLPVENFYFERNLLESYDAVKRVGTNEFSFYAERDKLYNVNFYPVGSRGLDLTNIPDGSIIQLNVRLSCDYDYPDTLDYFISQSLLCHHYMDEVGNWLNHKSKQESINDDQISGVYKFEFEVIRPDGAISVVPQIWFNQFVSLYSNWYTLEVMSASINMKVSTTYWQQWQNEQNGEMLNDMVNGTPEQNAAADESAKEMEQASGKLDNLGDQLSSVDKPNVDDINVSADKLLGGMASTSMLTAPITEIWKDPLALSILTVVVTIVLVSWVFFGKK